jgi:hypothetical protein
LKARGGSSPTQAKTGLNGPPTNANSSYVLDKVLTALEGIQIMSAFPALSSSPHKVHMLLARSHPALCVCLFLWLALAPQSCHKNSGAQNPSAPSTNAVAEYFAHVDRQYESSDQQAEIIRALHDMLEKPVSELRNQRYADYEGKKDSWPLTTLLKRYFVPNQAMPDWTEETFYRDIKEPAAQDEIRKQLAAIEKEKAAH